MRLGWMLWLPLSVLGYVLAAFAEAESEPPSGSEALVIEVEGAIGPATSAYIEDAISDAEGRGAELLVLRMDTPGGLDTSMRAIVKAITTSNVPVVTYVAPSGSRAASAGTYILYASHIAAMAPGTNLGAATPVELGGLPGTGGGADGRERKPEPKGGAGGGESKPESQGGAEQREVPELPKDAKTRKLVNDAVAYLRSLAKLRGRNADWAERAVREGASLTAQDALAMGVIDLMAPDLDTLKKALDGRRVQLPAGERRLQTRGLALETLEPDWRNRLLAIISNPNVAYILMLLGIYGLIYEFANPGAILPGAAGFVSLMLALYAFQVLPVSYAGVALILLGVALMVAEAFAPGFGALGLSGAAAFVVGSVILIDTDAPGFGISLPLILGFAVTSVLAFSFVVGFAVRARARPVVTGGEQLIGAPGHAIRAFERQGSVRVHGEVWAARTDAPLEQGQSVRVTGRDGLVLRVSPETERRD
jgi:membrane-bound serine protease (ClpP class)